MANKEHGNTGNRSAKKEVTKAATIIFRLEQFSKNAYVQQAQREDQKLIPWILARLDASLDEDLKKQTKTSK